MSDYRSRLTRRESQQAGLDSFHDPTSLQNRLRRDEVCQACVSWAELAVTPFEFCPVCGGIPQLSKRVELAAHCGHQASLFVLGQEASGTHKDLERWTRGLCNKATHWVGVLAVKAAAELCLVKWERMQGYCWTKEGYKPLFQMEVGSHRSMYTKPKSSVERPRRVLEATEKWLHCPCQKHAGLCLRVPSPEQRWAGQPQRTIRATRWPTATAVGLKAASQYFGQNGAGDETVREGVSQALVESLLS